MKHLYTIASATFIPSLGITGPLTEPTRLDEEEVAALVWDKKGAMIYQHNPGYLAEKVLVTKDNFNAITFMRTRKEAALEKIQNLSMKGNEVKVDVVHKDKKNKHNKNKSWNNNAPRFEENKPQNSYNANDNQEKETSNEVTKPDAFVNTAKN